MRNARGSRVIRATNQLRVDLHTFESSSGEPTAHWFLLPPGLRSAIASFALLGFSANVLPIVLASVTGGLVASLRVVYCIRVGRSTKRPPVRSRTRHGPELRSNRDFTL